MDNKKADLDIRLADIPFLDEKGETNQSKLKGNFKALFKRDPLLPALLACRCALRTMPLISPDGLFDARLKALAADNTADPKSDKSMLDKPEANLSPEKRQTAVNEVISYFSAQFSLFLLLGEEIAKPLMRRDPERVESAARAAADAAYAADAARAAASAAASAAARAAANAAANAAAYAAYAAYAAAYAVRAAGKKLKDKLIICLYRDLQSVQDKEPLSEAIQALSQQPLWWGTPPDEISQIWNNQFKGQLLQISLESNKPSANDVAQKICEGYERVLYGEDFNKPDPEQISIADTYNPPETERETVDKLNRGNLVQGLVQILQDKKSDHHLTIGLLGRWGMGKSRVLDLLREKLKPEDSQSGPTFLFGEFNAWSYEYCDNIQAAMTHEVFSALAAFPEPMLPKEEKADPWLAGMSQRGKRVGRAVLNGLKRLWFNLFTRSILAVRFDIKKSAYRVILMLLWLLGILYLLGRFHTDFLMRPDLWQAIKSNYLPFAAGATAFLVALNKLLKETRTFFAQPYTKELLTYVKLPDYAKHLGQIAQMQQDIKYLCDLRLGSNESDRSGHLGNLMTRKKRLLFVVDDLDRCQPQGIVKTLEAIRLVLDIPQVKVIIAVDQRIALAALAKHYEDIKDHHELNSAKAIARDYLGKMIHLPVQLPDTDTAGLRGYLSHLWNEDKQETARVDELYQQYKLMPEQDGASEPNAESGKQETDAATDTDIDIDNQSDHPSSSMEKDHLPPESRLTDEKFDTFDYLLNHSDANTRSKNSEPEPIPVAMTDQQKVAFRFWLDAFSLRNPRQVKRLHSSYNLLRLVLNDQDKPLTGSQWEGAAFGAVSNGLMIALLIQEFVNNQDDNKTRVLYQNWLDTGQPREEADNKAEASPNKEDQTFENALTLIRLCGQQRFPGSSKQDACATMIALCKLYVLPAINVEDEKPVQ